MDAVGVCSDAGCAVHYGDCIVKPDICAKVG